MHLTRFILKKGFKNHKLVNKTIPGSPKSQLSDTSVCVPSPVAGTMGVNRPGPALGEPQVVLPTDCQEGCSFRICWIVSSWIVNTLLLSLYPVTAWRGRYYPPFREGTLGHRIIK